MYMYRKKYASQLGPFNYCEIEIWLDVVIEEVSHHFILMRTGIRSSLMTLNHELTFVTRISPLKIVCSGCYPLRVIVSNLPYSYKVCMF